ncbi:hypothetical protein DLAC_04051 [Tieghemostelium lacteum]|uniref:Uncharacterized protein n=1 Tax=Tieghemostelium lacteum TaxID=361077 RepID=A0A151ZS41_TIELA|nr:hypothetical protein DLAC_04051 [Tieghemostelium lacteum]|eukprot:KYQ96752.1 hypothetical protein DLAC_04051 [Tieghemostelium lacteum]
MAEENREKIKESINEFNVPLFSFDSGNDTIFREEIYKALCNSKSYDLKKYENVIVEYFRQNITNFSKQPDLVIQYFNWVESPYESIRTMVFTIGLDFISKLKSFKAPSFVDTMKHFKKLIFRGLKDSSYSVKGNSFVVMLQFIQKCHLKLSLLPLAIKEYRLNSNSSFILFLIDIRKLPIENIKLKYFDNVMLLKTLCVDSQVINLSSVSIETFFTFINVILKNSQPTDDQKSEILQSIDTFMDKIIFTRYCKPFNTFLYDFPKYFSTQRKQFYNNIFFREVKLHFDKKIQVEPIHVDLMEYLLENENVDIMTENRKLLSDLSFILIRNSSHEGVGYNFYIKYYIHMEASVRDDITNYMAQRVKKHKKYLQKVIDTFSNEKNVSTHQLKFKESRHFKELLMTFFKNFEFGNAEKLLSISSESSKKYFTIIVGELITLSLPRITLPRLEVLRNLKKLLLQADKVGLKFAALKLFSELKLLVTYPRYTFSEIYKTTDTSYNPLMMGILKIFQDAELFETMDECYIILTHLIEVNNILLEEKIEVSINEATKFYLNLLRNYHHILKEPEKDKIIRIFQTQAMKILNVQRSQSNVYCQLEMVLEDINYPKFDMVIQYILGLDKSQFTLLHKFSVLELIVEVKCLVGEEKSLKVQEYFNLLVHCYKHDGLSNRDVLRIYFHNILVKVLKHFPSPITTLAWASSECFKHFNYEKATKYILEFLEADKELKEYLGIAKTDSKVYDQLMHTMIYNQRGGDKTEEIQELIKCIKTFQISPNGEGLAKFIDPLLVLDTQNKFVNMLLKGASVHRNVILKDTVIFKERFHLLPPDNLIVPKLTQCPVHINIPEYFIKSIYKYIFTRPDFTRTKELLNLAMVSWKLLEYTKWLLGNYSNAGFALVFKKQHRYGESKYGLFQKISRNLTHNTKFSMVNFEGVESYHCQSVYDKRNLIITKTLTHLSVNPGYYEGYPGTSNYIWFSEWTQLKSVTRYISQLVDTVLFEIKKYIETLPLLEELIIHISHVDQSNDRCIGFILNIYNIVKTSHRKIKLVIRGVYIQNPRNFLPNSDYLSILSHYTDSLICYDKLHPTLYNTVKELQFTSTTQTYSQEILKNSNIVEFIGWSTCLHSLELNVQCHTYALESLAMIEHSTSLENLRIQFNSIHTIDYTKIDYDPFVQKIFDQLSRNHSVNHLTLVLKTSYTPINNCMSLNYYQFKPYDHHFKQFYRII